MDVLVHTPFECANIFSDVSTVVRRAYDKLFSLLCKELVLLIIALDIAHAATCSKLLN